MSKRLAIFLALASCVGCGVSDHVPGAAAPASESRVFAQFIGEVNPATGKLTFHVVGDRKLDLTARPLDDHLGSIRQYIADQHLPEWKDTTPDCNDQFNTVDAVTHTPSLGTGTCAASPGTSSWGGQVSIGNYYTGQYLCNVWAIITSVSNAANAPCGPPAHWPSYPNNSEYPANVGYFYMGHTFTPFDGTCPRDSITGWRRWQFQSDGVTAFSFQGEIWGDVQSTPCGPETTIEGINFEEDSDNNPEGYLHIPPDPIGAAGPNHVVSVTNVSIEWFEKSGANAHSQGLDAFFSSVGAVSTFDPKVIYDQYAGRFLVVVLDQADAAPPTVPEDLSRIYVAVSQSSDPNGGWHFLSIDALERSKGQNYWVDYPGFAVGPSAVYITGNVFSFRTGTSTGSRLWIIDKGQSGGFYTGGSTSPRKMTVSSQFGTVQPAHMYGTPPGNVGTFLVQYDGLYYTQTLENLLRVYTLQDPLGAPSLSPQLVNVGVIDDGSGMPNAEQLGTTTQIETNDRRTLNAVWRNGSLWTTAQIMPAAGGDVGEVTAHWWELNAAGSGAITLAQQGSVGGEDIASGTHTFMPSIMVDRSGNMALAFSASAGSIYAGAYYVGRYASDPLGTVRASHAAAEGLDYYIRTFGGTRNRWGDYSGLALDPSDESTFWLFNEYPLTRGTILPSLPGEDGRWGTRFASFSILVPPTP